jgi:hypothetical protein
MPAISTRRGSRVCRTSMASASPSTGKGLYASIRRYPSARARLAAASKSLGLSNSAIRP